MEYNVIGDFQEISESTRIERHALELTAIASEKLTCDTRYPQQDLVPAFSPGNLQLFLPYLSSTNSGLFLVHFQNLVGQD